MSTRANIVLQETGYTLWLYHHCDGYPSYLGSKLMQIMEKHKSDYDDIFDIANEIGDIQVCDELFGTVDIALLAVGH